MVAVASQEAREAWAFPIGKAAKEAIEGTFETQEHILQDLALDVLVLFPQVFDLWQISLLLIVGNAPYALLCHHCRRDDLPCLCIDPQLCPLVLLIGVLPFRKRRVVELSAPSQRPEKHLLLLLRRV